jgi:nucleoside-specific outer membrane channel protein Tsx
MPLRSSLLALSLLAATAAALASPSVYPTGVTRYDPALAHNQYVLFSGQDRRPI